MTALVQSDYEQIMDDLWAATPQGYLDGYECVAAMKDDFDVTGYLGNNWRQTEWAGFYVEYCLEKWLTGRMCMNMGDDAVVYISGGGGNCRIDCIDSVSEILVDAKTHSSDKGNCVVTNDYQAIQQIISDRDEILFYVVSGDPVWDVDGQFRKWHTALKGGKSAYSIQREREGRSSRMRKSGFAVTGAGLYLIDEDLLGTSACFESTQGRNSNGLPRPSKATLDLSQISPICYR